MKRQLFVGSAPRAERRSPALALCLAVGVAGAFVVGASGQSQPKSPSPADLEVVKRIQAEIAASPAPAPAPPRGGEPGFGPCRTYTNQADFSEGHLFNLTKVEDPATGESCLRLVDQTRAWPFIGIANSSRGTAVRIAVDNSVAGFSQGDVLGEYRTAPQGRQTNPSRTTVDPYGNIWLTNRAEASAVNNVPKGSVTRIGLLLGGTRGDKHPVTGAFSANPLGEYMQGPFSYCTCEDRDGDGLIRTSRGYDWGNGASDYSSTFLGWDSGLSGADDAGGVVTADDECVTAYVRIGGTAARFIGIDPAGDVWTGGGPPSVGGNSVFELIDGDTAQVVPSSAFNGSPFGYGGLVDKENILWSAGTPTMRFQAPSGPVQSLNNVPSYGVAIDPVTNFVWTSSGNFVYRMDRAGVQNGGPWGHGGASGLSQGIVVDSLSRVWVAHGLHGFVNTVGRLTTAGALVGNVMLDSNPSAVLGRGPTGVAVDTNGKVWSANLASNNAMRIDPSLGVAGQVDLVVDLGGGSQPYNYSDMTGSVFIEAVGPQGSWTVIHDGGMPGCEWGLLSWNANADAGTSVKVRVRASDSPLPSGPWTSVSNNTPFSGVTGQYLQVQVTLCRTAKRPGNVELCDLTICKRSECILIGDKGFECDIGADGTPVFTHNFTLTNMSGQNAGWLLVTPQSPAGLTVTPNVINFNPVLMNGDTTSVSIALGGLSEGEEFCYTLTLLTPNFQECCSVTFCDTAECPCLTAEDIKLVCVPGAVNTYTYTVSITNETLDDIWHLFLLPTPGVNVSPNYFNIVNETGSVLSPGEKGIFTVTISGPNALPGTEICIMASIHNQMLMECCAEQICITLPSCADPDPNFSCHLTAAANCCFPQPDVRVRLTICNHSNSVDKTFNWVLNAGQGPGCAPLAPGCLQPNSGVVVVAPGQCITTFITVNCDCLYGPAGGGGMACLEAIVTNTANGDSMTCTGKVTAPQQWWVMDDGSGTGKSDAIRDIPHGATARLSFTATNGSDKGGELDYQILATHPNVLIDGVPGGTLLGRVVAAPVGGMMSFTTDVSFSVHDPSHIHDVVVHADVNGDGVLMPVASIAVRSAPGAGGVDCLGDIDCNGHVNSADIALLLGAWGGPGDVLTDLNGDGSIGSPDLALLLGAWGPCD